MIGQFESVIAALIQPERPGESPFLATGQFDAGQFDAQLDDQPADDPGIARELSAAFIISLAGSSHPSFDQAQKLLTQMADSPQWAAVAGFYLNGLTSIRRELETQCKRNPDFADRLTILADWVSQPENLGNREKTTEKIWAVLFPEATGIRANEPERVKALVEKRTVTVTQLSDAPITNPAKEILFTSNVLLTVPSESKPWDSLPLSDELKAKLIAGRDEPQLYWYDHPIQVGVEPEQNEVIYGLRGLQQTVEFEQARGNMPDDAKLTCVLSVSATHRNLQGIARAYLEEQLTRSGGLQHLDVFAFTEADTQKMIDEVLAPAAKHYLQCDDAGERLAVLGVDGSYGRHYSFLKAIAAFWSIFIHPEKKATFKFDLDQVFPQKELVEQAGASAFEHFATPLWGAQGVDSTGQPLELGMISGCVVNENDIGNGLFTPDVRFPNRPLSPDEFAFFSGLPQALSTEAEMMTRYNSDELDGKNACIQRIHVLGGMNGILIDSLRRHRPFTPSFIGRAEDQAYILSVLFGSETRLAYVHKDGLIMRHDKEAFAQEALRSAYVGRLIGDYVRILYYTAYAHSLTDDITKLKDILDPFTGCFVSRIPMTVAHLRFALKAGSLFAEGQDQAGLEFVTTGAERLAKAIDFSQGENNPLGQCHKQERLGWNLYYDTLAAVEEGLNRNDAFAQTLREKARRLVEQCSLRVGSD